MTLIIKCTGSILSCFGLIHAPDLFQDIMHGVLKDVVGNFVLVHLDDSFMCSRNADEGTLHLKLASELLCKHQLYVRWFQCSFARSKPNSFDKNWPMPQSKRNMQQSRGLAKYICNFFMGYAQLAVPSQS